MPAMDVMVRQASNKLTTLTRNRASRILCRSVLDELADSNAVLRGVDSQLDFARRKPVQRHNGSGLEAIPNNRRQFGTAIGEQCARHERRSHNEPQDRATERGCFAASAAAH